MLLEPVEAGLLALSEYETTICKFDRMGVPPDIQMLNAADKIKPDVAIIIGQHDGPYRASTSTFLALKKKCPTVLLVFDGGEALWKPRLEEYRDRNAFSLVVNIDGNMEWTHPDKHWTTITPTAPHFYRNRPPLSNRPVRFGFAGGYSSSKRREIVEYLVEKAGLVIPRRNETYGSYQAYADFMCSCRIVLNIPFTGTETGVQVKGRVMEAGMAGCVLLEHVDSAAQHWFKPWTDYACYSSKEEAVEIVSDLLGDPKEMTRLATNLHQRVQQYVPKLFWQRVMKEAGVE
jgi:hypothetical protein